MSKKKTHDEFVKELYSNNNSISVIGKYENTNKKIEVVCNICKHKWTPIPSNLLRGHGCPMCSKKYKFTQDSFVNKMSQINENIEIIGTYVNSYTKLLCKCKIDDYEWFARPVDLINGHGCPKCCGKLKKTHEDFIRELENKNPNIIVTGKYITNKDPISCKCKICNHQWTSLPSRLLIGCSCPKCVNRIRTHEDFINDMKEIDKNILILGTYEKSSNKILCRCKIDKTEWEATPNNLLKGHGCPTCNINTSKGEIKICQFLEDNNIEYIPQKTFSDLKGVNDGLLSYDFYLPKHNTLVEFQGEQHIVPVSYFGGNNKFKIQQEHDKRKRKYAKLHNIKLLEIWYYDFKNIENILKNHLCN